MCDYRIRDFTLPKTTSTSLHINQQASEEIYFAIGALKNMETVQTEHKSSEKICGPSYHKNTHSQDGVIKSGGEHVDQHA